MDSHATRPLLELRNIRKQFQSATTRQVSIAVDDVSFSLYPGEHIGIVGGSGSGKTTLIELILRLVDVTSGQIILQGKDITNARGRSLRWAYRQMQAVFQHPMASFDTRRTLGYSLMEGMRNAGMSRKEAQTQAGVLLERCGLHPEIMKRFPYEVSGGQCQRVALARALALRPSLLICDEATSALDVTVQRQILGLLHDLCAQQDMTLMMVSHDIALVQQLCSVVAVMKDGQLVEFGSVHEVMGNPQHSYTRALIDAVLE